MRVSLSRKGDKIKFVDVRFKRWQIVGFRESSHVIQQSGDITSQKSALRLLEKGIISRGKTPLTKGAILRTRRAFAPRVCMLKRACGTWLHSLSRRSQHIVENIHINVSIE